MTQQFRCAHEVTVLLAEGGDPAAMGAAVTVELCGHWDHDPPCRWPHHTQAVAGPQGHVVQVDFDAPPDDEAAVRRRIDAALSRGTLTGPEGRTTTWELVSRG